MSTRVVFNDFLEDTKRYVDPHRENGKVLYRGNWADLSQFKVMGLNDWENSRVGSYLIESLAENTCHWENRIRARWIFIVHAVDNFAVPTRFGEFLFDVAKRLNSSEVSAVAVPTVHILMPKSTENEKGLLSRWSVLGKEFIFGDKRHTPIFNPRHVSWSWIHYVVGLMPTFNRYIPMEEAVGALGLHTGHIMGLSRANENNLQHAGSSRNDTWYTQLSVILDALVGERKHLGS